VIKVLIVEDNNALIRLLKQMFESEGIYRVKTAKNGDEGYVAFLSFKPDIILTDIEMPVKNGLDMMRDIRMRQPWIKTIYMSADPDRYRSFLDEEKTKYRASFLDKPFSGSKVIELINESQKEGG